jgi:hypothetical protein
VDAAAAPSASTVRRLGSGVPLSSFNFPVSSLIVVRTYANALS